MQLYQQPPLHLRSIWQSLWQNHELIWQMSKREILGRYRGSLGGIAWSFIVPLFMLGVYTFVFSVVFATRWGEAIPDSKASFAIVLFAGLIVHNLFAECINRAPHLITQNANYVKKVVFPLEILPWSILISALFHAGISIIILLLAEILFLHQLPWTALLLPLIWLPFILGLLGLCWFLAALGVYLRDIGQLTGIITTILLFMSPVFYPISRLPESFQHLLLLNPLTFIIEQTRQVLLFGGMPNLFGLIIYTIIACVVFWLGFIWFQKTRRGFADVL